MANPIRSGVRMRPRRCHAGLAQPPGVGRSLVRSARNFVSSNTNLTAESTSGFASWGRGFTAERSELNTSDIANLWAQYRGPRNCPQHTDVGAAGYPSKWVGLAAREAHILEITSLVEVAF